MVKIDYEINMSGAIDPLTGSVYLKPCPFCGAKYNLAILNTHTAVCWVECDKCEAQIHGEYFSTEKGKSTKTHFELAIESAKDAWNRRTSIR